jgi:hypothetical protein
MLVTALKVVIDDLTSMVVRPVVRFAVAWEGSVLLVPVPFEPGHVVAVRLGTVVNTTMATFLAVGVALIKLL